MREQGKGKIINISSDTSWLGAPMILHYVASKGAIFAFTRALARELSGTQITVTNLGQQRRISIEQETEFLMF